MNEPLKTITVIVDRRVLADLLRSAAEWPDISGDRHYDEDIIRLAKEVESGERCELYAKDWPVTE
jgi:hypothetical protein